MHHPYRKIGSLEGAAKRSPIAPNLQSIICLFLVVFDFRVIRIDDIIIIFLLLLSTLGVLAASLSTLCALRARSLCLLISSGAELIERLLQRFGCLLDGFRIVALDGLFDLLASSLDFRYLAGICLVAELFDRLLSLVDQVVGVVLRVMASFCFLSSAS